MTGFSHYTVDYILSVCPVPFPSPKPEPVLIIFNLPSPKLHTVLNEPDSNTGWSTVTRQQQPYKQKSTLMALQALCNLATTSTYQFTSRVHLAAYVSTVIKDILDTGCTYCFLPINTPVFNLTKHPFCILVGLPDKSTMQSTHTGDLLLPELPPEACSANIFPKMNEPLFSFQKLCDAGCKAEFK